MHAYKYAVFMMHYVCIECSTCVCAFDIWFSRSGVLVFMVWFMWCSYHTLTM